MRKSCLCVSFLILLTLAGGARAQGQNFFPVEGPNLKAKLDAAIKLGRANSPPSPFWVAYGFDVRPGVAVDYEAIESDGSFTFLEGTSVMVDASVETRNLGVFLLYEPGAASISRMEIYNLARKHEYSGYPVFWLSRAGNDESLNFLKSLAQTKSENRTQQRAILGIALHDDPRVEALLEEFVRVSSDEEIRSSAVFWLGRTPGGAGKRSLLSDIARNELESAHLRRRAIGALGQDKDTATLVALESLYAALEDQELKKRILDAVADNDNQDDAAKFLIHVASDDADSTLRKKAIGRLGFIASRRGPEAVGGTGKNADAETEVQKQVVVGFSNRPKDEAIPLLMRIARTHPKTEVRKQAIFWLGQTGDPRALEFFKEILSK